MRCDAPARRRPPACSIPDGPVARPGLVRWTPAGGRHSRPLPPPAVRLAALAHGTMRFGIAVLAVSTLGLGYVTVSVEAPAPKRTVAEQPVDP